MGAANAPDLSGSKQAATIDSPGNGDFAGFRMVVEPDGKAWAVDGAGRASQYLDPDVARQFFSDLAAAGPLGDLAKQPCPLQPGVEKTAADVSAAVVITWNGQHSPELSCASDARATKLASDVTTIQRALYVQAYRVRTKIGFGGTLGNFSIAGNAQQQGYSYSSPGNASFRNNFGNSGISGMSNPFAGRPYGTSPYVGLPYASPYSGAPSGTLPLSSLPRSSIYSGPPPGSTPSTGSPFSSSPFSASPFGSVNSGSSIMSYP